jgi:multiple sugar transport system permease protein
MSVGVDQAGAVGATQRAGRARRRRRRVSPGWLYIAPAGVLVVLLFLYPIVYAGWISLNDWPLIGNVHRFVGLDNYTRIPDNDLFMDSILYTIEYTVFTTIVLFGLGLGLALLGQGNRRGSVLFRAIWFLPYVIGFGAAGLLWWALYNDAVGPFPALVRELGLASGRIEFLGTQFKATASIIAMVSWKVVGFQMIVLIVALHSIPHEYYEAARIDGASVWQRFRFITLPLLKPTIALLSVISITGSLLAFDQFLVMTQGGPDGSTATMVYAMYRQGFVVFQLGSAAALAIVLLIALVIFNGLQIRVLRSRA